MFKTWRQKKTHQKCGWSSVELVLHNFDGFFKHNPERFPSAVAAEAGFVLAGDGRGFRVDNLDGNPVIGRPVDRTVQTETDHENSAVDREPDAVARAWVSPARGVLRKPLHHLFFTRVATSRLVWVRDFGLNFKVKIMRRFFLMKQNRGTLSRFL